ncbi:MAG: XdhC family protein [Betaproteobacteria bacterium]|nr:XdhC family protein [Betaproteobacteria bacterium]
MDNVDISVLRAAIDWRRDGHRVTLGTVVRTWGSAPRPVGAMVVIRDDGQIIGSVSGGCVEDDLVEKVMAGRIAHDRPELATYGVKTEDAQRWGLPCGGTLQLVFEPVTADSRLVELHDMIARHELAVRELDLATGQATLRSGNREDTLLFDGKLLRTVHGPRYRLLLIGAGQVSQYLATMAQSLGYQVTVCDPREEYAGGFDVAGVDFTREMPDDAVVAMNFDTHTACVALTHDPKLDDLALMEALKSPAFYVGALGSRANNDKRRRRLEEFDLSAGEIARLHGPVGLYLGSKTPPEIAVSVLAEMTAVKNGVTVAQSHAAKAPAVDPGACALPSA